MRLTIELTPEQEARLFMGARLQGIDLSQFAQKLVIEHLPEPDEAIQDTTPEGTIRATNAPDEAVDRENSDMKERDPEFVALVKSLRGKYAHTAKEPGTEELHRERQRDKQKEEAKISRVKP